MLKGFKKSVDVDFIVSKNRVKMEEAFKQVEKEIGQVYPLIIGGKRIETEKKITSLNPATKEVLGYACSCSQEFADEALDIANQTEYGLTGSVYSEDRANIQKAKVEFQVGNLYFNRKSTTAVVLQHPFGGFNMSGTDAKTGTADYLTNFLNLKSATEDLID